jgi:plasmid stability protein
MVVLFLRIGGTTVATLNVKNFPDGVYRRIKQRASKNRRSISQEVTQILEEAVAEKPKAKHSLLELAGLGKEVWEKALNGKDAAEYIREERDSWDKG